MGSWTDWELRSALARLVAAGLVFQREVPPRASFLFKHALVQDIAYSMLLLRLRRSLHGRIAKALEQRFPDATEARPETLAHHFTEAGLFEKAVGYWCRAGRQSVAKSGFAEAIAQLRTGLRLGKQQRLQQRCSSQRSPSLGCGMAPLTCTRSNKPWRSVERQQTIRTDGREQEGMTGHWCRGAGYLPHLRHSLDGAVVDQPVLGWSNRGVALAGERELRTLRWLRCGGCGSERCFDQVAGTKRLTASQV